MGRKVMVWRSTRSMETPDYDDPEIDQSWCDAQRATVIEYLKSQQLNHGEVGDWPAWHIAPYLAVWAVESVARPGWIGWWAISGDLPTDYISASEIDPPQHPRKALRTFAEHWRGTVQAWDEGKAPARGYWGSADRVPLLRSLLAARVALILEMVEDEEIWESE